MSVPEWMSETALAPKPDREDGGNEEAAHQETGQVVPVLQGYVKCITVYGTGLTQFYS